MRKTIKEKSGLRGHYVFTLVNLITRRHFELQEEITKRMRSGEPGVLTLIRELNSNAKAWRLAVSNIVPTVGRAAVANQLTNSSPSPDPLFANYCALGTGVTAPANGDTTLQTEVYRNQVASRTNASNVAYVTGFFNATETTGTYRETGIFIAGTASANSGTLLSRVSINITKSSSQTLTVDWTLTIT